MCSSYLEYVLVKFLEDGIMKICPAADIKEDEEEDAVLAKYEDGNFYRCIVLSQSGKFRERDFNLVCFCVTWLLCRLMTASIIRNSN